MYQFRLLDPRKPFPSDLDPATTLGVEVTVPVLAAKCAGNIDPQHSGGDARTAACEAALTWPLPPAGTTIVTVKPDLDALAAMAVLYDRWQAWVAGYDERAHDPAAPTSPDDPAVWTPGPATREVVARIGRADCFDTHGAPWQPLPLPTRDCAWPDVPGPVSAVYELAPWQLCAQDESLSLDERVSMIAAWLRDPASYRTGHPGDPLPERTKYVARARELRFALVDALASGDLKREALGPIAVVETTHPAALQVGYSLAPVVVARNPAFAFAGGRPHAKYTIAQWREGYADLRAVATELTAAEHAAGAPEAARWGGSPTILGSPQGEASRLPLDEVVAAVERHLLTTGDVAP